MVESATVESTSMEIAAAETARRRLDTLKLEIRGRQKNSSVQMGTYEQNIGLKKSV